MYGFAELLPGQRQRIKFASRVANPAATPPAFCPPPPPGPAGVLPRDYPVTCFSLTGYSGGGKKMIAEYEAPDRSPLLDAPSLYSIGLAHKHLPEMQKLAGLDNAPVFVPILGTSARG